MFFIVIYLILLPVREKRRADKAEDEYRVRIVARYSCDVFVSLNTESKIVGYVTEYGGYSAEATVRNVGNGWLVIVDAPVRAYGNNENINCAGYYIQEKDTITIPQRKK